MLIICWDFDGTIITSGNIYKKIFLDYIKPDILDKNNNFFSNFFAESGGKHPINIFKELKENNFLKENIEFNIYEINKRFNEEVKNNGLSLTKGILDIFKKLSQHENVIMAIVTSTNINNFIIKFNSPILSELKKYFGLEKNIYICEEVGNKEPKPSSNGYIYAINDILLKNKIENQENTILAIEDAVSGCISASNTKKELSKNNKLIVIGYNTIAPKSKNDILLKNGADYVFNNSKELLNFIISNFL